ncbi:MAG: NUDIX hydrolase [Candidatus Saccharibacteria bacterium]
MTVVNLKYDVIQPFGNLFRKKCVLVAVENDKGQILVGPKSYMYPPTIDRLLGGGVDDGEDLKSAAVREMYEELNIVIKESDLIPLTSFVSDVTDEEGHSYHNETYVYYVNIGDRPYKASDDISSVVALTKEGLSQLGDRYNSLPKHLWYKGEEGAYSWADYAKLYGPVHKTIAKELMALK